MLYEIWKFCIKLRLCKNTYNAKENIEQDCCVVNIRSDIYTLTLRQLENHIL